MLAYDYLKENPQVRHKLIHNDWATIFTDPATPYAVKQELKEIQKIASEPSDAIFFWHKQFVLYRMADIVNQSFMSKVWHSHWPIQLYTIVQSDLDNDNLIDICYRILSAVDNIAINIKLEYSILHKLINLISTEVNGGHQGIYLSQLIVASLAKNTPHLSTQWCDILLKRCTLQLISNSTGLQLQKIIELLNDVDDDDKKFNSINEIQREHDERTERETQKLMKLKSGINYIYNPEFEALVKEHGYFLPTGPAALVQRGKQHHNCVGTYDGKHKTGTSRIIFSRTATIELLFIKEHDLIVATKVEQNKGVRNVTKENELALTQLRIALTGKSWDFIKVEEVHGP